MRSDVKPEHIESVRAFNRFYTRHTGVLQERLLDSRFPLTQARVLFELAQRQPVTAKEIGETLGLDAGYLSRIIQGFVGDGLLERRKSDQDARSFVLTLSAQGSEAFSQLDQDSRNTTTAMLSTLSVFERERLLRSLHDAQNVLSPQTVPVAERVVIRRHRIGDIGWAIERHGRLYADEYSWNAEFEALVATLFASFVTQHDPAFERCWIAELDGERIGCVFVVRNADDPCVAQLRCLLVDPLARGLGVGRRLVAECIDFARSAGYFKMLLWTNDVLVSARRIYEACGFSLIEEEPHHSFGHDLIGQVWMKDLSIV